MIRERTAAFAMMTFVAMAAAPLSVRADGMIVPTDPNLRVRGEWAVRFHHVDIQVHDQVAEVVIEQAFVNLSRRPLEVEYLFPVPPGAGISELTLIADGKEMPGKLLQADDARRIYEDIVRSKKDPALLEYVGYGLYKTSVFPLPPGGERHVVIRYTAVCNKDGDLVRVHYPLNTEKFSAKAIDDVLVTVNIRAAAAIGPVYSPTHDLVVKRLDPSHVTAEYHVKDAIPATDFELYYQDGADQRVEATILSHRPSRDKPGYFMALVTPRFGKVAFKVIPKDVVLVMDTSSSMRGEKMDQARKTVAWVVDNLNDGDRFNVVAFGGHVETFFSDSLVSVDAGHRRTAVELAERLQPAGGTNIDAALATALSLLDGRQSGRPAYVLFITDGKPTIGQRDEAKIIQAVRATNTEGNIKIGVGLANEPIRARLFTLGVGYDVNVRLLDLLADQNRGLSSYVKENESLEPKVAALYTKLDHPVMTDVCIELPGAQVTGLLPRDRLDLFADQQLVIVGRYDNDGEHSLRITGEMAGERHVFEYPVRLTRRSEDSRYAFLERLWAIRQVGRLMDQVALYGESEELTEEIIRLSRQYGIMTPYTSFLAEEDTNLAAGRELRRELVEGLAGDVAPTAAGEAAQRNAALRGQLRSMSLAGPEIKFDKGEGAFMFGNTRQQSYEADEVETVANLRQVNQVSLYRRGNQWYEPGLADVDVHRDAATIRTIRQFDDDYFALAAANNHDENEVLASQQPGEELLIRLRGQVYRILPAGR